MCQGPKFYAAVFLGLGALLSWLAARHGNTLPGVVGLSAGLAFATVGVAYGMNWPVLLGKRRSGSLMGSSYLLLWPYLAANYASLLAWRWMSRQPPYQQIVPGLFLGGRLLNRDRRLVENLGFQTVVDLTCEFSEVSFLRTVPAYRCLPLLDGTAPSPTLLAMVIDYIRQRLAVGPVYVHCAMGHGRSATVVMGYLVVSGAVPDLAAALHLVRSIRPAVRPKPCQHRCLEQYLHARRTV